MTQSREAEGSVKFCIVMEVTYPESVATFLMCTLRNL